MEPNLDNSHTYYTIFKNHPPTITCYLVCCETIIYHSSSFKKQFRFLVHSSLPIATHDAALISEFWLVGLRASFISSETTQFSSRVSPSIASLKPFWLKARFLRMKWRTLSFRWYLCFTLQMRVSKKNLTYKLSKKTSTVYCGSRKKTWVSSPSEPNARVDFNKLVFCFWYVFLKSPPLVDGHTFFCLLKSLSK